MELSILVPARNEIFLAKTIENILENIRGDTEVIVVCDGAWADPSINDHPRVNLIYHSESIGQRAATNEAARLSQAKFIMKADAHCAFDEGFDLKLMADCEYDWTVVPRMYNLHAFNWRCRVCGDETYQGPTLTKCKKCGRETLFERVMIWKRREGRKSDYMWFDKNLRFSYFDKNHLKEYDVDNDMAAFKHKYSHSRRDWAKGDITDQMCAIGACWMMHRERFWELGGVDEGHGSWGQMGVEIACKSWLSGGRQVVNKKTWFAHMFRTQGGDFKFPYPLRESEVEKAREYSRKLWKGDSWPKAIHPLWWMIEKFSPLPGWEEELKTLKEKGQGLCTSHNVSISSGSSTCEHCGEQFTEHGSCPNEDECCYCGAFVCGYDVHDCSGGPTPTKGLIYYTDNHPEEKLLLACQKQLTRCMDIYGFSIISVSQKQIDFGRNIVMDLEWSVLSMYKQILKGLEESETDIIFMIEHDLLYHPSHFDFTPSDKNVYYYDRNVWAVDADTGKAVFYHRNVPSLLCAYRELLLEHYRRKVEFVEANGFKSRYGFSPPKGLPKELRNGKYKVYFAEQPSIDIRHSKALTRRRMDKSQFRSERSCRGWTEADEVPGWDGKTKGRFDNFLQEVGR